MKTLKTLGKLVVFILFFGATWFLNLIVVAVFSIFFGADAGESVSDIELLCFLIVPVVASLVETIVFAQKWDKKRRPKQGIGIERTITLPNQNAHSKYPGIDFAQPPIEPVLPASPSPLPPQSDYFKQTVQTECARYGGVEAELLSIDLMEGHEFEYWSAALLRKIGFFNVEVTQGSGDQGVDILAEKDGIRYAIQCKCYSKDLGNKPVQEVNSGKMMPEYHCQIGVVMTNRYFTQGAKDLAAATGTLLWDRDWIKAHIQSTQFYSHHAKSQQSTFQHTTDPYMEIEELLPIAVDVVLETGQASVSILQRRLNLGYAQAARTMDALEERGIVSSFCGSKPRDILITKEQWIQFKNTKSIKN